MNFQALYIPTSVYVAFVLWAAGLVIAGYVYRHAVKKSRVGFIAAIAVMSTLFFLPDLNRDGRIDSLMSNTSNSR